MEYPYATFTDLTPEIVETFSMTFNNTSGESGELTASYKGGAQLQEVASMIQRFLVAAGFTYVTEVVIETSGGNDVSSNF
jgi:hypothetical protein